jgi:predicted ribosomally synthesized peptide with SipW-like signal peptide
VTKRHSSKRGKGKSQAPRADKVKKKKQRHAEKTKAVTASALDGPGLNPKLISELPASTVDGATASPELEEALRCLKEEVLGNLDAFRPLPVLPRSTYEGTSSELDEVFRTLREEILYTYPAFVPGAEPVVEEAELAEEQVLSATDVESEGDLAPTATAETGIELTGLAPGSDEGSEPIAEPLANGGDPVEVTPEITSLDEFRSKKARAGTKHHRLGLGLIVALVALILGVGGGGAYAYFSSSASGSGSVATARIPVTTTVTAASGAADLVPGGTGAVSFTLTSADPFGATFNDVTGASVISSSNASGCPTSNLTIAQTIPYAFSPAITVTHSGSSATESIAGLVRLSSSAPSACQGVIFTVNLTLSGTST